MSEWGYSQVHDFPLFERSQIGIIFSRVGLGMGQDPVPTVRDVGIGAIVFSSVVFHGMGQDDLLAREIYRTVMSIPVIIPRPAGSAWRGTGLGAGIVTGIASEGTGLGGIPGRVSGPTAAF